MKRAYLTIAILAAIVACFAGCVPPVGISTSSTRTTNKSSAEREHARKLSDSIAHDLVKDNRAGVRMKLERSMRDYADEKSFSALLDQFYTLYGQPSEYEYKMDEVGTKTYPNGAGKPMRKFWYAVKTDKYPKGTQFLFIEVVPDENGLAGSSFAIVMFPKGVPSALQ